MGKFVSIGDFSQGTHRVFSNKNTDADLDAVINEVEKDVLVDLLGITMGEALLVNETLYPTLVEPFNIKINNVLVKSKGIKTMLKGFVYFEYLRKKMSNGNVRPKGENSENLPGQSTDVTVTVNEALDSYRSIQIRAFYDKTTYPDFDGVEKRFNLPF